MKIAYVGNFTQEHCTENHLALTLRALGHEVVELQENGYTSSELSDRLDQEWFDLFLFTRTWGETVQMYHLENLKKRGIPSASYHLDLYVGLKREDGLDTDPFWRTDYVFTPDGSDMAKKVFEEKNINHFYMKPAVYKADCYEATPNDDNILDVVFVGGGDAEGEPIQYGHTEWPYRGKLIKWLKDTYQERFHKFGHPQRTVRNKELNQLYADAKVVVGDSLCLNFDHPYYWSDRVYETMGRGGFIIHPFIEGMQEEFIDGKNIVFYEYNNWKQLKAKIDYYLTYPDEREAIRKAGHEFVKNNATYEDRLKQMLKTVFEDRGQLADIVVEQEAPEKTDKPVKINLGAGSEPTEGWINVDWLPLDGIDIVQNLLETPWKIDSNIADEIKAIDVLEHMPNFTPDNKSTPIAFVEECHRILQTGGKLTIQVPHYLSPNLWIDPTHVRGYDPKSMDYFDPETDIGKWYGYYSDKKFKVTAEVSKMDDGQPSNVTFTMVKR